MIDDEFYDIDQTELAELCGDKVLCAYVQERLKDRNNSEELGTVYKQNDEKYSENERQCSFVQEVFDNCDKEKELV